MRLRHPDGLELLGIAAWGFCLLAPVGAVAAPGENLVANPSFEELDSSEGGPADWQFSWKNTHSSDAERGVEKQKPGFAISEAEAGHGRRSVQIEVARPQDDGVLTAPTIRVDPSVKIYSASVWIKTRGLTETTARLVAVSLGEGGNWLGADYSLIVAQNDHDWRRYVGFFTPAKGAKAVRLRLWLNFEYRGTGTACFDDVSFEATDLQELPLLEYVHRGPVEAPNLQDSERGYLPYRRNIPETVYPGSRPRPGERLGELALAGFPGEEEAATLCLYALADTLRRHATAHGRRHRGA